MALRMRKEMSSELDRASVSPQIDTLIIVDRDVDMVTPMLTMLTYEGGFQYLVAFNI